jgi:AcrR family transcriptional regulator
MSDALQKVESLRERNRRQTHHRIAEVGMDLFLSKGYEATTLDEIATAAGISRRTFFYYFKSKDDLVLAHFGRHAEALKISVLQTPSDGAPIDIVRDALMKLSTRIRDSRAIATVRLMRESEALRIRSQANYLQLEEALYEGLCGLWPGKQRRASLRLVAMASIGAMRVAVDVWLEEEDRRPLAKYIQDAFEKLKAEI